MVASTNSEIRIGIVVWTTVLGGTGFAAGFFGPIALNPEANQGPLVGILITGPLGALAGLALGTLYYCLPEPKVRGYVIEAEVESCAAPARAFAAALDEWEQAVARTTWATPPADWKETARRNVERDTGLVLTMRVVRRSTIHEHRKPWDAGRMTASPWVAHDEAERYYARDAGSDCAAYRARGRDLYTPFTDSPSDRIEPARVWPPADTTGFLRLMELGPVPAEYRRLLP